MNKLNKNTKKMLRELFLKNEVISSVLIALFLLTALYSIFIGPRLNQWGMHEGDIALKNVYAPYDFSYVFGTDDKKTAQEKRVVVEKVPYYLIRDIELESAVKEDIVSAFDRLSSLKEEQDIPSGQKTDIMRSMLTEVPERSIKYLVGYEDIPLVKQKTLSIIENIYSKGYVNDELAAFLRSGENGNEVVIYDRATGIELRENADDLISTEGLQDKVAQMLNGESIDSRRIRSSVEEIVTGQIKPNLQFDEERTREEKQKAAEKVSPVPASWQVEKNELIIEKGKRVSSRHIAQISQLKSIFRPGTKPTFFLGIFLLFILMGLVGAIYVYFTEKRNFLKDTKSTAIVLLNMIGLIIMADFIVRSPPPSYFIPMAAMGMILVLTVSFNVAFLSVMLLTILLALLIGGGIEVFLVLLIGSITGIYAVREARRRNSILLAGLLVGVAKFLAIVCIGLINSMEMDYYIKDGIWGIASGIFSGFLVMGLLPVFEHFFKVTTNISLLELSDLNHPLLKKLALEAPGTYHHSIMVGNLAESACDAIGANSLLARVGSYYHDIGKIIKAEYFTENELGGGSRHDNLSPSMSALIISKHVKEGTDIARKYKLNDKIRDFIVQHHGDSLISYFYQRALEKADDTAGLKEENFRYPGPRPQTKESAIIMLADSVEASSRSMDEPTPSSIRNLVKKILNNKFIDGQLDECDLTLKDMHKIAESFVRVLTGVFHTRPDYPEQNGSNGKKEQKKGDNGDLLQEPEQQETDRPE
jgi:hypothetical protein